MTEQRFTQEISGVHEVPHDLDGDTETRVRELEADKSRLERRLADALIACQRAETAAADQSSFLSMVVHELRNPLSSISGWLQIIGSAKVDEQVKQRAVASMTRSVRTLIGLVENSVEQPVSQQAAADLGFDRVQLPALLDQTLDEYRATALHRGVRLLAEIQASVPDVWADPRRLRQVIDSLLANALKFTAPGGQIHVTLRHEPRFAVLSIRDTGCGIAADYLPILADRSADNDAACAAACLGLKVAQRSVELHRGSITAESTDEGCGTRLVVKLPLQWSELDSESACASAAPVNARLQRSR